MRCRTCAWVAVVLLCGWTPLACGGAGEVPGQPDAATPDDAPGVSPGPPAWRPTGSLVTARLHHTTTLLLDGRVLVAGGRDENGALASAELYDPARGSFTATGSMTIARDGHTATLMPSGKVLIVGGAHTLDAELFDPATGSFKPTKQQVLVPRADHTATLLASGKVLVAGGTYRGNLHSAELYDPLAQTFTATGPMVVARSHHAAVLLKSDKVLVVGGVTPAKRGGGGSVTGELYSPDTGTFALTHGYLAQPILYPRAHLIPATGQVLVMGMTAEIYEPKKDAFRWTGPPAVVRALQTMTWLGDGKLLIVGGIGADGLVATVEVYDPLTGTFTTQRGTPGVVRMWHTATLLPSGEVLVVGGWNGLTPTRAGVVPSALAELYDPAADGP